MSWTKKELLPPLPPEAQALVDSLSGLTGSVVDILAGLAQALEVAKLFFVPSSDLFGAIMVALITEIENLLNDLFGTGIFQLVINPFTIGSTTGRRQRVEQGQQDAFNLQFVTPDDAIKLAIKSFDDPGDLDENGLLKRPNFSDSATVAGVGILITAKDLNLYISLLEKLLDVWALDDVASALDKAKKASIPPPPRPTGADWNSLRINQIKSLGDIQKELLKMLALTKGYTPSPSGIDNLIDGLKRKADDLIETVETFQAVIDDLSNIQGLGGVHILDIPPQVGGNNLLKASLPNPVIQGPDSFIFRYTFFLMYVGGGSTESITVADSLRKLVV